MSAKFDPRSALPILRHADLSAPVAVDAAGTAVEAGRFLADIYAFAARFPDCGPVVNLCADRYRFAVGFFAALLCRKLTLLPSSEALAPMSALLADNPDALFLVDGPAKLPAGARSFPFPSELEGAPAQAIPVIAPDQPAAVLFTSGSTGAQTPHIRNWGALVNSTRAAGRALKVREDNRAAIFGTVPHQHSYGLESTIMLALQHGFAFHRDRRLLPADIVRILSRMPAPRILVTTPFHLRSLMTLDGPLPALDRVVCATAPLERELALSAERRFAAPLYEIYGCTEIGQIATRRTVEAAEWTCIDGIDLSKFGGEFWASGRAAGALAPINDSLEPVDASRFLLKGRKSDVVNIAGKRSSLAYLNHHLTAIEGVRDGIFVMPENGRRLTAYVVAPHLSARQILAALRHRLDPAFLPRPIHLLDSLPRNAVGKLTREALDALESESRECGVSLSDNQIAGADAPGVTDVWSSLDYRFPADHPAGPGHFPGNPVIPGALLLDRMLDAMSGAGIGAKTVRVAKFLHPVRPGDAVTFRWRGAGRDILFECLMTGTDRVAMSGAVEST